MGLLNYDALRFWLALIIGLLSLGSVVYSWRVGRTSATRASIEAVHKRVTDVQEESRKADNTIRTDIVKLETRMDGLPNHEDLGKLHQRINTVDGHLQQIAGGITGLKNTVEMINRHLLEKDR